MGSEMCIRDSAGTAFAFSRLKIASPLVPVDATFDGAKGDFKERDNPTAKHANGY